MELPDEKIKKLQEIYRKKYGEDISIEQAKLLAEYFIRLYKVVYKV